MLRRRALLAGLAGLCIASPPHAQEYDVDLALVLAIDCSFSVDANEFRQQMEGLGSAFRHPDVKKAIRGGKAGRIAVAAVQWSDDVNQSTVLPWTMVAGDADADELGAILFATPRLLAEGGTSLSAALRYSASLFATAPAAERRVIDVSSDGRNNVGMPLSIMRDRLVSQGITINGIAILNEWPTLDTYFEANLAGGEGHFVIASEDYSTYAEAILRKLVREITGPGIS